MSEVPETGVAAALPPCPGLESSVYPPSLMGCIYGIKYGGNVLESEKKKFIAILVSKPCIKVFILILSSSMATVTKTDQTLLGYLGGFSGVNCIQTKLLEAKIKG